MGRGYLPPALKRAYQLMNPQLFHEQVRSSSPLDRWNRYNENRPPDAQYFLEDDDKEVAQAFGFQTTDLISSIVKHEEIVQPFVIRSKSNLKIAAYPPKKSINSSSELPPN